MKQQINADLEYRTTELFLRGLPIWKIPGSGEGSKECTQLKGHNADPILEKGKQTRLQNRLMMEGVHILSPYPF